MSKLSDYNDAILAKMEPKVHFYMDRGGELNSKATGLVDNTICGGNHGQVVTTVRQDEVTCKRCLHKLAPKREKRNLRLHVPTKHEKELLEMLDETHREFNLAQHDLDVLTQRVLQLERVLRYAADCLGEDLHMVIHAPTEFTLRELIDYTLKGTYP